MAAEGERDGLREEVKQLRDRWDQQVICPTDRIGCMIDHLYHALLDKSRCIS